MVGTATTTAEFVRVFASACVGGFLCAGDLCGVVWCGMYLDNHETHFPGDNVTNYVFPQSVVVPKSVFETNLIRLLISKIILP